MTSATSRAAVLELRQDSILPENLLVVASSLEPSPDLLRDTARLALTTADLDSKVAAVIASEVKGLRNGSALRNLQNTLPANIVLLSVADLLGLASTRTNPRDGFVRHLLEQSDLTKVSPFVLRSATPGRMFYGRQVEEASLSGAVSTSSVALLGGRRIGKTSLMLHVQTRLEEAGFSVLYGDCQTVRNWSDFGQMAYRWWGTSLADDFRPTHLFDLIAELASRSDGKLVLLLDEIDQLLDWDGSHTDQEVPEAFFRTCRTVSQEGQAQFVFSGERVIASRLWDPHSPHWNFCQPIPLRQLNRESADQLIVEPLASLQVTLESRSEFLDRIWEVTSGHPQILQFLGDQLVRRLNDRPPEARATLALEDLEAVVETYQYKEHYLETYWGQSTSLERLLSLLLAEGLRSNAELIAACRQEGLAVSEGQVTQATRMLDLYGIARSHESGYTLRAEWMSDALESYGGIRQTVQRYLQELG
jgi:hypothetical protein